MGNGGENVPTGYVADVGCKSPDVKSRMLVGCDAEWCRLPAKEHWNIEKSGWR